jgi:uridine kinase
MAAWPRILWSDRLFMAGLAVKLTMVCFIAPDIATQWFTPFVQGFLAHPSFDPWGQHLANGGDPLAFPYGPIMFITLLPGVALTSLAAWIGGLDMSTAGDVGLGITVLVIDFAVYIAMRILLPGQARRVTWFYWLSPIAIYVLYWHGQLDIVPVFFLLLSLLFLRANRFQLSGAAIGLAIAAKLSMILAVPFVVIYLYRNTRLQQFLTRYASALVLVTAAFQGPFLLSPGVRQMVLGTPQAQKVFEVAIAVAGQNLYILPLIYLLVLYAAWRVRRISFSLLLSLLGLGFFLVLLLTPAAPGWFLWLVPFLVFAQVSSGPPGALLGVLFSLLFVGFNLLMASGALILPWGIDLSAPLSEHLLTDGSRLPSLAATCLTAVGIVLAVRMIREGIQRNDYYRLSRAPLMIGIAGDSGAGKDTLAEALEDLFGAPSVAHLSGDDYHLWDRNQPMWQVTTHLNPRANDLDKFNDDALALADGRAVAVRHYSHTTGRYGHPLRVEPRDIVLVSGLHALYPAALRERIDVKIFLDTDESLRRAFKVRRDMTERGHSLDRIVSSIEARQPDGERYVKPQMHNAHIVFSLKPRRELALDGSDPRDTGFMLNVQIQHCLYLDDLLRCLIGLCALHVDYDTGDDGASVDMTIDGDVHAEDIALSAKLFLSNLDELLDLHPRFHDGMAGIMQLIVLAHSAQSLRGRLS